MPEEQIPRLIEGSDVRAHELDARAAFVHSCIDGVLNIEDIADVTVLAQEEVRQILEGLIGLQLAEWVPDAASSAPPKTDAVVDGQLDLSEELQGRIVETYHRIDKLNHYERLGVAMDADRKEIRRAYFALSKVFHPDSYFGKNLGPFKAQMEVVFRKITDSYEAIGRPKKREAYDQYLQQQMAVNSAERQMVRVEQRAEAMSRALNKSAVVERHTNPTAGQAWESLDIPDPLPLESAPPSGAPAAPAGDADRARIARRRELLERRLGGKGAKKAARQSSRSMPSPTARVGKKVALRDLTRSLKHTAVLTGGVDRANQHLDNARVAEANGDLAAAATSLRMALTLDSSNLELQSYYERVNAQLRLELVDIHRQQAKYEQANKLWSAAAVSWAKVVDALPHDAEAPRGAAAALMAAGGDLRKARDYAQRSLALEPDSVETRLLLARIYIGAGMDNSAAKELEQAAKLDPGHEMVKNLRRQLGG